MGFDAPQPAGIRTSVLIWTAALQRCESCVTADGRFEHFFRRPFEQADFSPRECSLLALESETKTYKHVVAINDGEKQRNYHPRRLSDRNAIVSRPRECRISTRRLRLLLNRRHGE
jgi:hypothetical protein